MLKAAIIGCGKVADAHAEQIRRIPGCELVAACDRELLMAQQLADRFPIRSAYSDAAEMLEKAKPDVVHITTPPASHLPLSRLCLEAGCHAYIEKPFALDAAETAGILRLAREKGLKVVAGHNHQFTPAMRRMRALVAAGYLGGAPLHIETYYGYELARSGYAGALLGDAAHWVRRLPGGLLQNIISHAVAPIAEYCPDDQPRVTALGFTSPLLRAAGEEEIVDELRVIVSSAATTAYLTFSSQMRPSLHAVRLYGPKNGLVVDQDQQTVLRLPGVHRKSYLEKFISPVATGRQHFTGAAANVRRFLRHELHMSGDTYFLIRAFYQAIEAGQPSPISDREILLTAQIMDDIFSQLAAQRSAAAAPANAVAALG